MAVETYVKPNMFNVWVKKECVHPKFTLLGGQRGVDGKNSTPMACLTGSGAIFTRGLGGGAVSPTFTEKIIKRSSALFFEFKAYFNI